MPFAPASVTAASARRRRRADQDRRAQEVGEPHRHSAIKQRQQLAARPSVPSTTTSASSVIADGPSSERTPTRIARSSRPSSPSRASARNASRSVASSPTYSATSTSASSSKAGDPGALVDPHRRADLEHLAAPVGAQSGRLGARRDRVDRRRAPPPRPARRASGTRRSRPCPRAGRGSRRSSARVGLAPELVDPPGPVLELGSSTGFGPPGAQQLGAVRSEVGDRPDRDHRPRLRRPPAADARDDAVAPGDRDQQLPRALGHARIGGMLDDRRQRAVDVEQDRRTRAGSRGAARAPRTGALTSRL